MVIPDFSGCWQTSAVSTSIYGLHMEIWISQPEQRIYISPVSILLDSFTCRNKFTSILKSCFLFMVRLQHYLSHNFHTGSIIQSTLVPQALWDFSDRTGVDTYHHSTVHGKKKKKSSQQVYVCQLRKWQPIHGPLKTEPYHPRFIFRPGHVISLNLYFSQLPSYFPGAYIY